MSTFRGSNSGKQNSYFAPFRFLDEHSYITKSGEVVVHMGVEGVDFECRSREEMADFHNTITAAMQGLPNQIRVLSYMVKLEGANVELQVEFPNEVVAETVQARNRYLNGKASGGLYTISLYMVFVWEPEQFVRLKQSKNKLSLPLAVVEGRKSSLYEAAQSFAESTQSALGLTVQSKEQVFHFLRLLTSLDPQTASFENLRYEDHLDYHICSSVIVPDPQGVWVDRFRPEILTMRTIPGRTGPNVFRDLLSIKGSFIVCTQFKKLHKDKVQSRIHSALNHYNIAQYLKNPQDFIYQLIKRGDKQEIVPDAAAQMHMKDLNQTAKKLSRREGFGLFTWTIVLFGEQAKMESAATQARKIFGDAKGSLIRETRYALGPLVSLIPGTVLGWTEKTRKRQKYLPLSQWVDIAPFYNHHVGPRMNQLTRTPALLVLKSADDTAINFSLVPPGSNRKGTLLVGEPGSGKCLAKGTPVLLHCGCVRKVEDIKVGDFLMGPDSKPRTVVALGNGVEEMYRITPVKGDSFIVNENHILSVKMSRSFNPKNNPNRAVLWEDGEIINISVRDYLKSKKSFKHHAKCWRTGVEFPERQITLDPYFLGLWLGDGCSRTPQICKPDIEVRDFLLEYAESIGKNFSERNNGKSQRSTYLVKGIKPLLYDLDLIFNKHIPVNYKFNTREIRLKVLAGLLDTDGHLAGGCFDWISVSETLADDTVFLARSLGFAAYKRPCTKVCSNAPNGPKSGTYFRVSISGNLDQIPMKIARKIPSKRGQIKDVLRSGFKVEKIGPGEYFGFQLDGDGLFLLGDFTVTHNSVFAQLCIDHAMKDNPYTLILDGMGGSYRTLMKKHGGAYFELTPDEDDWRFRLNPFQSMPDSKKARQYLSTLVRMCLSVGKFQEDAERTQIIYKQVVRVLSLPFEQRRISSLQFPPSMAPYLEPWLEGNQYGYVFDNPTDTFSLQRTQTIDFHALATVEFADVTGPLLFHFLGMWDRIIYDKTLLGTQKDLWIDEGWKMLENPIAAAYIQAAGRTWRKRLGGIVLLTQSVEELKKAGVSNLIKELCPLKLLLSNPGGDFSGYAKFFDLNPEQMRLYKTLTKPGSGLMVSPKLSKVFYTPLDNAAYWTYANDFSSNILREEVFSRFPDYKDAIRILENEQPYQPAGETSVTLR